MGKEARKPGGGHIDLAHGEPVQAAGEVYLVNGNIKYMDNTSGHYLPKGLPAQRAAEKAFGNLGFDVKDKYIEKYWSNQPELPRGGKWRPKK